MYEVVISVYPQGKKDAEPVREEILLETADLEEANELVEDALDLTDDAEGDEGEEEQGDATDDLIVH